MCFLVVGARMRGARFSRESKDAMDLRSCGLPNRHERHGDEAETVPLTAS